MINGKSGVRCIMDYYCLACRSGSEKINMRLLKKICKTEFEEKKELHVYSPVREVKEFCLKKFKIVYQPILEGYVIIATEYDLSVIAGLIRKMSSSSYGLVKNADKTYILKGSDMAYAAFVASFDGIIRESKVRVSKNIKEGTRITVIDGPMKDLKGKIIRINKRTRCLVEIPFLGELKRINLPINIVEEVVEDFDIPEPANTEEKIEENKEN